MKRRRQLSSETPRASSPRSRRWLLYGVAVVLILEASIAFFFGKDKWFDQPRDASHSGQHSGTHGSGANQPDPKSTELVKTNSTPPSSTALNRMVWIPGGTFWMSCDG